MKKWLCRTQDGGCGQWVAEVETISAAGVDVPLFRPRLGLQPLIVGHITTVICVCGHPTAWTAPLIGGWLLEQATIAMLVRERKED